MKLPSSSSAKKGAQVQQTVSVSKLRGMLNSSDNGLRLLPEDAEDVRIRFGRGFVDGWLRGRPSRFPTPARPLAPLLIPLLIPLLARSIHR